jgi:heme exporter protein C
MTTTDPTLTGDPIDTSDVRRSGGVGTATRSTRIIGILTIVAMGWLVAFGLGFSPEDRDQSESVRLLYVHVPTIWIAYLAFIVTAVSSALHFFGKSKSLDWDRLAGASAEIGTAFVAVTLVIGAMWGRLTWGVFWQWDARLTTTALLFVTYIGYLAVRRLGGTHQQRARRSAVIGMIAVLEIPLVHWSVRLWRSLHQDATILRTDGEVKMDGLMLFSLFVGVVAFSLLYLWLVLHRTRVMAMEDILDDQGLDAALAARRSEAATANAATTTAATAPAAGNQPATEASDRGATEQEGSV